MERSQPRKWLLAISIFDSIRIHEPQSLRAILSARKVSALCTETAQVTRMCELAPFNQGGSANQLIVGVLRGGSATAIQWLFPSSELVSLFYCQTITTDLLYPPSFTWAECLSPDLLYLGSHA